MDYINALNEALINGTTAELFNNTTVNGKGEVIPKPDLTKAIDTLRWLVDAASPELWDSLPDQLQADIMQLTAVVK